MADTVAEFINTSALPYAALQAGVTIVANSALETAVVRDLVISNPNSKKLSITIGAAEIIQNYQSMKYSGSEIVPQGGSMVIKTASKEIFNTIYSGQSQSTLYKAAYNTVSTGDIVYPMSPYNAVNAISPTASVAMNYIFFDAGGNFYYHSGVGTTLYKRAGGAKGAESQIAIAQGNTAYGLCYDGVRYIYAFSSNNIYTYDTQTNTVTSATMTGYDQVPDQNSAASCAIDGYVIFRSAYGQSIINVVNPVTGVVTKLASGASDYDGSVPVAVAKNSFGRYIIVSAMRTNNTAYVIDAGTSLSTPAVSSGFNISLPSGVTPPQLAGRSSFVRPAGTIQTNYLFTGNSTGVWNFDSDTYSFSQYANSSASIGNGGLFVPQVDASLAATHFGQIAIRATGIKTT